MTDAVREETWNHTAWLTAHMFRVAGDKKIQVKDVNPYLKARRPKRRGKEGFRELRSMLF